jgi:hypothetical protein
MHCDLAARAGRHVGGRAGILPAHTYTSGVAVLCLFDLFFYSLLSVFLLAFRGPVLLHFRVCSCRYLHSGVPRVARPGIPVVRGRSSRVIDWIFCKLWM